MYHPFILNNFLEEDLFNAYFNFPKDIFDKLLRIYYHRKRLLFLVDKSLDQVIGVQCYTDLDDDIDDPHTEESLSTVLVYEEILNSLNERARKQMPRAFAPDLKKFSAKEFTLLKEFRGRKILADYS